MGQELLYTSAEHGLKPGSRGFCTVLSTQGMSAPLAAALEGLSGYRPVYPPSDERVDLNPVMWSHLKLSVAGRSSHVLSRIADYGLDYSQRTNKIAHHVVLDANELCECGPARLLAAPGFMRSGWNDQPQVVAAKPVRKLPPVSPGRCQAWKDATGDAGWAGILAESFLRDPERPVFLIFEPGFDLLPLIVESISLLPPERRWEVTFSTYFTGLPQGVGCTWRCLLKDSPEVHQSLRFVKALRIDLTTGLLEPASGGRLVQAARGANVPVEVSSIAEETPHEVGSPQTTLDAASRPPGQIPSIPKKLKTDRISDAGRPNRQPVNRTQDDVESSVMPPLVQRKLIVGAVSAALLLLTVGIIGLFAVRHPIANWLKPDRSREALADDEGVETGVPQAEAVTADGDHHETPEGATSAIAKAIVDAPEVRDSSGDPSPGDRSTDRSAPPESKGASGALKISGTPEGKLEGQAVRESAVKSESPPIVKETPKDPPPVKTEVVGLPKAHAATTIVADAKSEEFSRVELTLWSPVESALEATRTKSKYVIKESGGSAGLADVVLKSTSNSKQLELKALGGTEKLSRIAWCRLDIQPNAPDQQRYQVFFHRFPIDNRELEWQMSAVKETELTSEVRWNLSLRATQNHLPELFSDGMAIQIGSDRFDFSPEVDGKASRPVRLKKMTSPALSVYLKGMWPDIKGQSGKQLSPSLEMESLVTGSETFGNCVVVLRLVPGLQLKRAFDRKYAQLALANRKLSELSEMDDESLPESSRKSSRKDDLLSKKVEEDLVQLKNQKAILLMQEKDGLKQSELSKSFDGAEGELRLFQSAVLKFEKFQADLKSCEIKSARVYYKLFRGSDKENSINVELIRYPEDKPSHSLSR